MNPYILLSVSVALGVSKNILSRAVGGISEPVRMLGVNLKTALFALLIFGIPLLGNPSDAFSENPTFWILSALYGLLTMLSQMFYIRAVQNGSVSVCALLYACGFLLPTFYAVLFCGEKLGILRGIGIAVLILSASVINTKEKSADSAPCKASLWLPYALGATAASGGVGIIQKITRSAFPDRQDDGFLFCAFAVMAVLSLVLLAFLGKKRLSRPHLSAAAHFGEIFLSLSVVLANKLNLFLSGVLPGSVFFPVVNGGCIAFSAIFSGLLFHEKFSAKKIIALCCGGAALLLISL